MSGSTIKKIAIISAMEVELSYVEEFLKDRADWNKIEEGLYENQLKKIQLITKVLGVGKVNAAYQTADLISEWHPTLIINIGYAGGLVEHAKEGDVAIGTEYVQVDFIPYLDINRPYIAESPKWIIHFFQRAAKTLGIHIVSGKIATGDFFLHDSKKKTEIVEKYHPIAFDMESAAIAQVATQKQVDFVSVRTFSDLADDNAPDAFENGQVIQNGTVIPIERRPVVLVLTALEQLL